ncbi:MAG: PilZ domain-containing protein [Sulfuricellaceae bacterium]|nr:PilZ domain-containing protein [Sulfuricellaceae bacterium]
MDTSRFSSIFFEARLPLHWQGGVTPTPEELGDWMHTNAVLLRAMAAFENRLGEPTEGGVGTGKILERLEAKIDLAILLLAKVAALGGSQPEPCSVALSAGEIAWIADDAPEVGEAISLTLHINPSLPQPLQLPASVVAVTSLAEGKQVTASLTHLSEECQDGLERMVFRQHRHHIQAMRGGR